MTNHDFYIIAALLFGVGAAIGFLAGTLRALQRPIPAPAVDPATVKTIAEATAAQCVATMKRILDQVSATGAPDPGRVAREAEQQEYLQRFRAEFPELSSMIEPS